jgi:hypothetical protein
MLEPFLFFRSGLLQLSLFPEAESLDVIGTKYQDFSFILFKVKSTSGFYSPPLVFLALRFLQLGLRFIYEENSILFFISVPEKLKEIVLS